MKPYHFQNTRRGFILYYIIIMSVVLMLFVLATSRTIDTNRLYLLYNNSIGDTTKSYNNRADITLKIDRTLNANGSPADIMSCS